MQKYTFICENPYDNSKITYESHAGDLNTLLEDFTHFLRGSGFAVNGLFETVPESDCSSEFSTEVNYSYDSYVDDYPEVNFDWPEDKVSLCPVCKIDTNIMKNHSCFDKNCPRVN